MALSKPPSDSGLEQIESYISDVFCPNYKKYFSILIMGKFGVGKSTLVNNLVGEPVAIEAGRYKRQGCTSEAKPYCCKIINGIEVRIWDSPGLQDGTENDDLYLRDIQEKSKGEIDLVIYCLKMNDTRFYPADQRSIKKLHETFGKELWEHTVIALTFANKVRDESGGDEQAYFMKELESWQEVIHLFFTNELNIQYPPIAVPTGYKQLPSLPQHKPHLSLTRWRTKFWLACYSVASISGAFNLVKLNAPKMGPNTASSNEGDSISLTEEEEATFLQRTWEIIKGNWLLYLGTAATCTIASVVTTLPAWSSIVLKLLLK